MAGKLFGCLQRVLLPSFLKISLYLAKQWIGKGHILNLFPSQIYTRLCFKHSVCINKRCKKLKAFNIYMDLMKLNGWPNTMQFYSEVRPFLVSESEDHRFCSQSLSAHFVWFLLKKKPETCSGSKSQAKSTARVYLMFMQNRNTCPKSFYPIFFFTN